MKNNLNANKSREKMFAIFYAVLLFAIPIIVITILPWAKHMVEIYGLKAPVGFDETYLYEDLIKYVSSTVTGLIAGFGLIFIGINVKNCASRLAFWGCLAGLTYVLLAGMSYLIYFDSGLVFLQPLLVLVRYSGTLGSYTMALIVGIYLPLLYQIIRQRNKWKY
ncbi:hypothetical protein [Acetobacterium tundrae]|uniref:Uncharacterized protein n=1 Tax=Acetobacterium tundrae TaxID=132932 RepID=A0ABR6WM55_9FIRM|nr:hypothetical protein [Acetobacterium tundrae]MBC3797512.1 hypothetical protein [Acetobacterium tundrae]